MISLASWIVRLFHGIHFFPMLVLYVRVIDKVKYLSYCKCEIIPFWEL